MVLQKTVLVGTLVVAGTGAWRLVGQASFLARDRGVDPLRVEPVRGRAARHRALAAPDDLRGPAVDPPARTPPGGGGAQPAAARPVAGLREPEPGGRDRRRRVRRRGCRGGGSVSGALGGVDGGCRRRGQRPVDRRRRSARRRCGERRRRREALRRPGRGRPAAPGLPCWVSAASGTRRWSRPPARAGWPSSPSLWCSSSAPPGCGPGSAARAGRPGWRWCCPRSWDWSSGWPEQRRRTPWAGSSPTSRVGDWCVTAPGSWPCSPRCRPSSSATVWPAWQRRSPHALPPRCSAPCSSSRRSR